MSDLSPEEYQKEYDAEMAKLEAAGAATPAPTPAPAAPVPAVTPAPAVAVDPEVKPAVVEEPQETVEELKQRLARAEKEAHDNKAWGTKNAQELAEARRREREANRPEILDANPDLEKAIRYVATEPAAPAPDHQAQMQLQNQQFIEIVERAHPGIFKMSADAELVAAIAKRKDEIGDEWFDPLTAIRIIGETKLAHTETQTRKRFAAESETRASKSAMAVPGAGGGSAAKPTPPSAEDEANRIRNMSDADFEKERRRVLGY